MTQFPLFLGEALELFGAPGWAAVVASVLVALWHSRRIFAALSTLSLASKVALGIVAILVVSSTGVVPGVEVKLALGKLLPWLGGLVDGAGDLVTQFF